MDIAQNSVSAGAGEIRISVAENTETNTFLLSVTDDGCGMTDEVLARVTDPYYTTRTTRKVGMGIPLFKQNAEQSGGWLEIESEPGKGTMLKAMFIHNHIDRPDLGDMAGVISLLISANENIRFRYIHEKDGRSFELDTNEINEILDGVPVSEPGVTRFIREMIRENLTEIHAI